jgi:hypothetical protein
VVEPRVVNPVRELQALLRDQPEPQIERAEAVKESNAPEGRHYRVASLRLHSGGGKSAGFGWWECKKRLPRERVRRPSPAGAGRTEFVEVKSGGEEQREIGDVQPVENTSGVYRHA